MLSIDSDTLPSKIKSIRKSENGIHNLETTKYVYTFCEQTSVFGEFTKHTLTAYPCSTGQQQQQQQHSKQRAHIPFSMHPKLCTIELRATTMWCVNDKNKLHSECVLFIIGIMLRCETPRDASVVVQIVSTQCSPHKCDGNNNYYYLFVGSKYTAKWTKLNPYTRYKLVLISLVMDMCTCVCVHWRG